MMACLELSEESKAIYQVEDCTSSRRESSEISSDTAVTQKSPPFTVTRIASQDSIVQGRHWTG